MPSKQIIDDSDSATSSKTTVISTKTSNLGDDELPSPEQEREHMKSTLALCVTLLTQTYLLISVYPYSGFMAISFLPWATEENVGSYAGFISSSMMIGRTLSSYAWGRIADTYGRKVVLLSSLGFSIFFSLMFGLAQSYETALIMRLLLGFTNSLVATTKTLVSELAKGNKKLETKGVGLVISMWGWGFMFCPALSGILAEPVRQYPSNAIVQKYSEFLSTYPFILPNMVGAILCSISIICIVALVPETLPEDVLRPVSLIFSDLKSNLLGWMGCCLSRRGTSEELLPIVNGRVDYSSQQNLPEEHPQNSSKYNKGYLSDARMSHTESSNILATTPTSSIALPNSSATARNDTNYSTLTLADIWMHKNLFLHLMTYWLFSLVATSIDEAFPLFCISKEAGLGLSEVSIGEILSVSGIFFGVCQYFVYTGIVNKFGVYSALRIGALMSAPMVMFIPISTFLNNKGEDKDISLPAFLFLSGVIAIYRIFSTILIATVTLGTNRLVPASQRATLNGYSVLGGSIAKGVGPVFAGWVIAFCFSSGLGVSPHFGAFFSFGIFSIMGFGAFCVSLLLKEGDENSTI